MLTYPPIDPVIFQIGPIAVRWYGVMWLSGFIYSHYTLKKFHKWVGFANADKIDNIISMMVVGIILGARFVYVLFYNWAETVKGPWWETFAIWHGGLAFHGGVLGSRGAVVCGRRGHLERPDNGRAKQERDPSDGARRRHH